MAILNTVILLAAIAWSVSELIATRKKLRSGQAVYNTFSQSNYIELGQEGENCLFFGHCRGAKHQGKSDFEKIVWVS